MGLELALAGGHAQCAGKGGGYCDDDFKDEFEGFVFLFVFHGGLVFWCVYFPSVSREQLLFLTTKVWCVLVSWLDSY